MLTSYGMNNIVIMAFLAIVMLVLGIRYFHILYVGIPLVILSMLLLFFTFWFFRDPDRTLPTEAANDSSIIIAPADGEITEIVEEVEPHYLKTNSKRISIFLSPLDVHVNRIPVSGVVEFYHYNPGKFMIASRPKASELNEQSRIGLKTEHGNVLFKQIVGAVARRLVCTLEVGDTVRVGERFGMMKFGSRMDIALPTDATISVNVGDKVVACETIIARLNKKK